MSRIRKVPVPLTEAQEAAFRQFLGEVPEAAQAAAQELAEMAAVAKGIGKAITAAREAMRSNVLPDYFLYITTTKRFSRN